MNRKIILLGYMGSGKSVIGKRLAEKIQLPFIDLDTFIEKKEEKKIDEIFQQKGEIYFRKKEREYLNELLLSPSPMVLALGGGTPCYGDAMQMINKTTENVFYLQLSFQELTKRLLPQKKKRPLIAHLEDVDLEDFIRKHLFDRNPFYMQANNIIKISGETIEEIIDRIEQKIKI
ncbi:MAG: shikimate kinase [Capnocytophaga sp.]|nr:shikimate kinase [Capnocytophaga sp.]